VGAALLSLPFAGWACAGASDGVRQLVIPQLRASSATCMYTTLGRRVRNRSNNKVYYTDNNNGNNNSKNKNDNSNNNSSSNNK